MAIWFPCVSWDHEFALFVNSAVMQHLDQAEGRNGGVLLARWRKVLNDAFGSRSYQFQRVPSSSRLTGSEAGR